LGSASSIFHALLLLCIMHDLSSGQPVARKDTVRSHTPDSLNHPDNTSRLRFTGELEYSLTFSNLLLVNWMHENDADHIMGLQNLKYRTLVENSHGFSISNLFIHNLGIQSYFDSITKVYMDDNTLTTKIAFRIKKQYSFDFSSNLTTQCLQGFDYTVNDSGKQVLLLNSAFLTPLTWTFSLGAGITWKEFGSLTLGLTGGKLTYVRQTRIFKIRHIHEFWGVKEGKNPYLEYGLSLQFLVNKNFLKRVHWDCDLLLFKNYNCPIDLNVKNMIGIRINKFFKTSIHTRLFYEEKVSKNLQLENLVSIGFYLHL
jgi:hypothetical protein